MNSKKIDYKLYGLSKSKFRSSFHLNKKTKDYVRKHGLIKVSEHAYDFIEERIKPAYPKNDGKQTPMRQTHPVFIAQHATGTCCRGCLEKWHQIPIGHELNEEEVYYVVDVIMGWIKNQMNEESL